MEAARSQQKIQHYQVFSSHCGTAAGGLAAIFCAKD
jgi:hypothetical protein